MMTEMQKIIGALVIGIVIGAFGFWIIDSGAGRADISDEEGVSEETALEEENTPNIPEISVDSSVTPIAPITPTVVAGAGDEIAVDNQMAGEVVQVKLARLSSPGWVVVHEDRGGVPGNVLGAAWYPQGIHLASVELVRGTVSGGNYYVMLHSDNGDKQFDLKVDLPLVSSSGSTLMTSFKAN